MSDKPRSLARQAVVMAATAKCLEATAPLSAEEQHHVVFGLVITTLDTESDRGQRIINDLLKKMTAEVKR